MGGRGRSRTQRKHFRDGRENVWKRSKSDSQEQDNNTEKPEHKGPWEPFATQNAGFDDYYKEQGIVTEEEWDTFIKFLRKPLPAAFRINSSSQFCADIRSQLENDFMHSLKAEDIDGSEVDGIKPLPWYPENLAWHSNFSRMQLRKNQTLEKFHEFLKLENEIGNITRQEAVSMVPPLFLDVCPDHFVLDMCAAPGSKTFQLLEMIHMATEPGTLPTGMTWCELKGKRRRVPFSNFLQSCVSIFWLIEDCWHRECSMRPSFAGIIVRLDKIVLHCSKNGWLKDTFKLP